MNIRRRQFLAAGAATATMSFGVKTGAQPAAARYGLIGKMVAVEGQRDALIANLLDAVNDMPGCMSYVVAKDVTDPNAIWITEVWDSKASHDASLLLPAVKAAISRARPLIARFDTSIPTVPVGGYGLKA